MAARYDTAATIINDVAVEAGLAAVTDPFASTDQNFVLLCRLLKKVGRKLVLSRDWAHLVKEHTITTDGITNTYSLPADFAKMIDQSGWDRTADLPLGGPLTPEQWQYLASTDFGATMQIFARFTNDEVWLWGSTGASALPAGIVITFEYLSRLWVKPSGETSATEDIPDAATDTIMFDPALVVAALSLAWAKAKGFDTTEAKAELLQMWASVAGNDAPGAVLSLDRPALGMRFLDIMNIPETGYGT